MREESFDVVVVGGGGSGLAAALSAAERGLEVVLLEKRPALGGTTGIAVGSFTASGTSLQRAAGIDDDAELHAEDAARFAPADIERRGNTDLRRFFLRHAGATFEWMRSFGLEFHGPSPEPPNRVARMHNVVPSAKAYIATLQAALVRRGGTVICGASVEELLRDGHDGGRIRGVVADVNGTRRSFEARRGVVLAAGDYAGSSELIARHAGEEFREIEGIQPFATGEGQLLVASAGGALVNMDVVYGPELRLVPPSRRPFLQLLPASGWAARLAGRLLPLVPRAVVHRLIKRLLVTWQHPETALFDDGAILVNRRGERFCDETRWPEREIAVSKEEGKCAFIVLDGRLVERYSAWPHFVSTAPEIAYAYVADYLRLRPDVAVEGATLAAACARSGLPSVAVERTVGEWNGVASERAVDAFGRAAPPVGLARGPWVILGPAKAYFTTTEGGAAIDERFRVLDEGGEPIPGLYAVGQNGLGGQILWGHGLHIAWALTSGRLVGEELARVGG